MNQDYTDGRGNQPIQFVAWGGSPTEPAVRREMGYMDPDERREYARFVEKVLMPGSIIPSLFEGEQDDRGNAVQMLERASRIPAEERASLLYEAIESLNIPGDILG